MPQIVASLETPFEMWKRSEDLATQLAQDWAKLPLSERFAITITGELADCFLDRRDGITHIANQVQRAASPAGYASCLYYGTDGQFHHFENSSREPAGDTLIDALSASNWHALGTAVARYFQPDALLIDVGSTTTDVIAIREGQIATNAKTDFDRLADESLVYVGCSRTPVCSLVENLSFANRRVPVMNELFATIDDARLILGLQEESPEDTQTADGRSRTYWNAKRRLAKMIGRDAHEISEDQAKQMATEVVEAGKRRLSQAVTVWWRQLSAEYDKQDGPDAGRLTCVLSGHGQDLAVLPAGVLAVDLRDLLDPRASRCAPAWAVACLAIDDLKSRSNEKHACD